ncbi:hypothetical protein DH86_00000489 [Scytalidium sp. 3C]|nr:hypothetical protein DH86_00000489 [Scytalidium sp. 3C]
MCCLVLSDSTWNASPESSPINESRTRCDRHDDKDESGCNHQSEGIYFVWSSCHNRQYLRGYYI